MFFWKMNKLKPDDWEVMEAANLPKRCVNQLRGINRMLAAVQRTRWTFGYRLSVVASYKADLGIGCFFAKIIDFLLRIAKVLLANSLTTGTTFVFALLGSLFEFLCLSSAVDATPFCFLHRLMLQVAKVCCNQSCRQFINKMERYGNLARINQAASCCPLSTLNDSRCFLPTEIS